MPTNMPRKDREPTKVFWLYLTNKERRIVSVMASLLDMTHGELMMSALRAGYPEIYETARQAVEMHKGDKHG